MGNKSLLLAFFEESQGELLERVIHETYQVDVDRVESKDEALEEVQQKDYDAILLDYTFAIMDRRTPAMDPDVIREIREKTDAPIYLLVTQPEDGVLGGNFLDRELYTAAGVTGYIEKDLSKGFDLVKETLDQHLG